jgi:hypothetical protein
MCHSTIESPHISGVRVVVAVVTMLKTLVEPVAAAGSVEFPSVAILAMS